MKIVGIDHIVLCVTDVAATRRFYQELLGMRAVEESPGKWALRFGSQKFSLQEESSLPEIARGTTPGSANFCLLAADSIDELVERLRSRSVEVLAGPSERIGACGPIRSVYFRDPDGNLVEVSNQL